MARFFARAWHTASEESAYGIKISLSESPFTYQYALLCGKNKRLVLLNGTLHVRCRAWPSISTKKAAAEHGDLRRSGTGMATHGMETDSLQEVQQVQISHSPRTQL